MYKIFKHLEVYKEYYGISKTNGKNLSVIGIEYDYNTEMDDFYIYAKDFFEERLDFSENGRQCYLLSTRECIKPCSLVEYQKGIWERGKNLKELFPHSYQSYIENKDEIVFFGASVITSKNILTGLKLLHEYPNERIFVTVEKNLLLKENADYLVEKILCGKDQQKNGTFINKNNLCEYIHQNRGEFLCVNDDGDTGEYALFY